MKTSSGDPVDRLVNWLSDHPQDLERLVIKLGIPVPKCEGHGGPCKGVVLYLTSAMTQYAWDGQGENPNRDQRLCPRCSDEYQSEWQERWDEYRREVL